MEDLIRLRSSMQSLTDNEYFETFIKSLGRDYLSSIIFNSFNYKLQTITSKTEIINIKSNLSKLSQKATNIIVSRQNSERENKTENNVYRLDKIDKLPLDMISNISSFSSYSDLTSFELCNRTIFIGSRHPPTLYSLPTKEFAQVLKYCTTNKHKYHWKLHRFRFCKSISLWLDSFFNYDHDGQYSCDISSMYISLSDLFDWRNVESLSLMDTFPYEYKDGVDDEDQAPWHQFTENLKLCDLSNIKSIRIQADCNGFPDAPLAILPCVKYVDVGINPWDTLKINFPPSTKGVILADTGLHQDSQFWTDNLESMHCCVDGEISDGAASLFKNVKELCAYVCFEKHSSEEMIQTGLPYLEQLERVYYEDRVKEIGKERDLVLRKLWKIDSINSIHIQCKYTKVKHYVSQLMNVYKDKGLSMKQSRMKVRIQMDDGNDNENAINEDISNILKQLIEIMAKRFNDFMFIAKWKLAEDTKMNIALENIFHESMHTVVYNTKVGKGYCHDRELSSILSLRRRRDHDYKGKISSYVWYKFAISNKNCRINGYSERWLKKCYRCESTPLFADCDSVKNQTSFQFQLSKMSI